MKSDHVQGVLREVHCEHCAASFETDKMPVSRLAEMLRGFSLMHRLCPKPEAPSPQMSLPGTDAVTRAAVSREAAASVALDHDPDCGTRCIDASTDETAPEIDPPGPYARFEEMYPMPVNATDLCLLLALVLPLKQYPGNDAIASWHQSSGIFNAIANWARIEKAHADAGKREPISGLTLPRREPMPEKLAELLGVKPKQKKGARPLTSPPSRKKNP